MDVCNKPQKLQFYKLGSFDDLKRYLYLNLS